MVCAIGSDDCVVRDCGRFAGGVHFRFLKGGDVDVVFFEEQGQLGRLVLQAINVQL